MLLWSFWSARAKSVVKVFLYNCLPERSATTVFPNSWHSPPKQDICSSALCSLKCKSFIFIIFDNYYNKWLLLLFFVIFSASLSGSDDFVISNSLDGNGAYSQLFYEINFAHKLNSQLRVETRLLSKTTYIWWRTYFGPRNDPRTSLLGHASDNTK